MMMVMEARREQQIIGDCLGDGGGGVGGGGGDGDGGGGQEIIGD